MHRRMALLALVVTMGIFAGCGPTPDPLAMTNKAGGAPWYRGIINQRGVHFNGTTYFCFQAGGRRDYLDPYIMSYDHATGAVTGPVKVGDDPLAEFDDTHGNPGMIVDDLGYIHVIYGGHGVDRGEMRHAVSRTPEDLTAWDHLDNIRRQATYPTLIKLDDGTLYYFYRAGSHLDDWVYVISTDHGRTFSEETALMSAGTSRTDGVYFESAYTDSWYGAIAKGTGDTLHYVTRYHACADDRPDPYHVARRANVYYLRMGEDGVWRNIQGDALELPVDLTQAEARCRVYESGPKRGPQQVNSTDIVGFATDAADNPCILFESVVRTASSSEANALLAIGDLANGTFTIKDAPASGALFHRPDARLEIVNGSLHVSDDNGDSWNPPQQLHPQHGLSLCAPLFSAHPDARLLATEPRRTANKRRINLYLWGDNGFISP